MGERSIGRYRIVRRLGAGGMGQVFEGFDDQLQRPVAIKGLAAGVDSAAAAERLRREALACAALSHPNIAHVYEIISHAGADYLVMEFIQGRTVAEMLRVGPLAHDDVMRIGESVARALAAAHERGIVHRDVKPENVMMTPSGHVKVLDFGVAKRLTTVAAAPPGLTLSGTVVGTSSAMSPEQALGRDVDHRSDIFSLGSLLYFMATGRSAFLGETAAEIMVRVARAEHVPLRKAAGNVPPELDAIVEKCLSIDPADRYDSALEVAEQLRRLRATATFATRAMPTATLARVLRRPGAVATAVAAAVVIAALGGAWLSHRPATRLSVVVAPVSADSQDLVSAAIFDALTTALETRVGLDLVPGEEVDLAGGAGRRGVEVAKAVGADELLEASVTRAPDGNEARVSLVAMRGADGTIRWSSQVNVSSASLLGLESLIAAAAARAFPGRPVDAAYATQAATEEAARAYLAALSRRGPRGQLPGAEATGLLARSVELAPRWVEPALALVDADLEAWQACRDPHRLERARHVVEQLRDFAAGDPRVARRTVMVALARGDVKLAEAQARSLTAGRPESVLAWRALAEVEERAGALDAAADALRRAQTLRRSWFGLHELFRLAAARGDVTAARDVLAAALELSPDNPLLLTDSADLATRRGDRDRAAALARRLVALAPGRDSDLRAAMALVDLGRPAAAADLLGESLRRRGDDVEMLAVMAAALHWAGRSDAARHAAGRALAAAAAHGAAAGDDVRVERGRALAHALLGQGTDAVIAAHAALALAPDEPATLYTVALVAAINGDAAACRTWSDEAARRGAPASWFDRPELRALASRPAEPAGAPRR